MPFVNCPGDRIVPRGDYRCRTVFGVFGIAVAATLTVLAAFAALVWWATAEDPDDSPRVN